MSIRPLVMSLRQIRIPLIVILAAVVTIVTARAGCAPSAAAEGAPMMIGAPGTPMVMASAFLGGTLDSIAPPPGTLGQTYQRLSHPIPEDEHPRTAMLAVNDGGNREYLSIRGMGGFRMKNGIWLFETNSPLVHGVENIVRVEARRTPEDVAPFESRFVRLIPGRIVYLDF